MTRQLTNIIPSLAAIGLWSINPWLISLALVAYWIAIAIVIVRFAKAQLVIRCD